MRGRRVELLHSTAQPSAGHAAEIHAAALLAPHQRNEESGKRESTPGAHKHTKRAPTTTSSKQRRGGGVEPSRRAHIDFARDPADGQD